MHEKLIYPKNCTARIIQIRVEVPESLSLGESVDIKGKNKHSSEPIPISAKRGLLGISYSCEKIECAHHLNHQDKI